jgi:hypothetical protein
MARASEAASGDRCFTPSNAEAQTVPALLRPHKKHYPEAARLDMELLFAQPRKLIGDGCHAGGHLARPGDLRRGRDMMRLRSRFRRVGQLTKVWRCEALR